MADSEHRDGRGPRHSLPVSAILAAGISPAAIGLLALVGWRFKLPTLAGFGPDIIMAPSTAALFVLYGTAITCRSLMPTSRVTYLLGATANIAGAAVAISLLALSYRGAYPDAELLGFPMLPGAGPVGHMSQATALCFLLASITYLASPPSSEGRPLRDVLAISSACLLIVISLIFLCARIFGLDFHTENSFELPALNTLVAFLPLGLLLFAVASHPRGVHAIALGKISTSTYVYLSVFICLTIGIVAGLTLYYRNFYKAYRASAERQLSSVTDMKVRDLVHWRKERLWEASLLFHNPPFSALVRDFIKGPKDTDARPQLKAWLRNLQANSEYARISLLDAAGVERLAAPDTPGLPSDHTNAGAVESLRSGRISFLDFERDGPGRPIHLSILVPVFDNLNTKAPLGVICFRIDPIVYLYPAIQRWPMPSLTAETLLVRREGNDVVFLNDPRFQENSALNLRFPLSQETLPAARAASGREGIVEGVNYHGRSVLADLRAIPDSPWFLVTLIETSEVYAPLKDQNLQLILLSCVLVFGAGSGVAFLWRQDRVHFYKQMHAAEQDRAKLAAIVESSEDAIIGKDLNGRVTSWNAGAERLFGYQAQEMIGQSITRIIPMEHRAEELNILSRLRAGERINLIETERNDKTGRPITVSLTVSPVRDSSGSIIGAAKIARDITALKRAHEDLRVLNAKLEQRVRERTCELEAANKELEAFSYSVSHDLRAPLRSIDGFSRILLEDYAAKLDDEGHGHLNRVRAATQRMAQLIDDLLNLSRVTRAQIRIEKVDLGAVAGAVAEELRQREPGRTVEFSAPEGVITEGDPHLLRVALENLLGNAWKFTCKEPHPRIEFGSMRADGRTDYFVRDNGAGFDARYAAKLFSAFQRLHSNTDFPGTGIGLATVQRIIHRHGGRVWAEGEVNKGATFYFNLGTHT